jgi:hypothetical protein
MHLYKVTGRFKDGRVVLLLEDIGYESQRI